MTAPGVRGERRGAAAGDDGDDVAALGERTDDLGAEEAGGSGDEDVHGDGFPACVCGVWADAPARLSFAGRVPAADRRGLRGRVSWGVVYASTRMSRRVVVTGIGVVSAIGIGVEAFWDALAAGRSGARALALEGLGSVVVHAIDGIDGEALFGRREARRMDRVGHLAAHAATLALADAGRLCVEPEALGASVGCAHGGASTLAAAYDTFAARGADRVSPFAIPLLLPNSAVSAVARVHGLRGPSASPSTACAAGADAIGFAYHAIKDGRAEAMVAGGADAPLVPFVIAGYRKLGALSPGTRPPEACSRPFDRGRDGFVLAEGAGVLVLEERERALARGARIHAELAGYGQSCDADHLTNPDASGAGPARALRAALADAGLAPAAVGYVNAHATSTPSGDGAEARAIAAAGLLGAAVSSTKSMHGHMLGAAGAVEAILTTRAIETGILPPTINLDDPDDDVGLDHVRTARRVDGVDATVSSSFGFGGHNAALVLRRA